MSDIFDDRDKFGKVSDGVNQERAHRLENAKNVMTFGIPFLDDCFGGIMRNDVVVYGARTGSGKTELATIIAGANAAQGKRVHMFALEAEPFEIERRLKYQILADLFFKVLRKDSYELRSLNMNYLDWYMGKLDAKLGVYENEIQEIVAEKYQNLSVLYSKRGYSLNTFEQEVLAIQDETDLIIVDHLHYFNLEDDANENSEITRITRKIRELALDLSKPVVLLVHLRKSDRRTKQITPDEDEFHGSSNISKIATKIFTLAKARGLQPKPNIYPTYIRPLKCRPDGSRTRFIGVCAFNSETNKYDPKYELGLLNEEGTEIDQVNESEMKLPHWFKRDTATKTQE